MGFMMKRLSVLFASPLSNHNDIRDPHVKDNTIP